MLLWMCRTFLFEGVFPILLGCAVDLTYRNGAGLPPVLHQIPPVVLVPASQGDAQEVSIACSCGHV